MIVPNNFQFLIYKAQNINSITQESIIGIWKPYGENNIHAYDSPEVITDNISKEIKHNTKFEIMFSTQIGIGWVTEYITFENMNDFLSNLSMF